jgi:hypothetical protein
MVPEEHAKDALELLNSFRRDDPEVGHRDDHGA